MKEKKEQVLCKIYFFLLWLHNRFDIFVKKIANYIYEVIHHFPCLKTKESYDRWVTRSVRGFRHQISKAKYPKISQNVDRKYQEASREHRCTVYWEKTLRVSAIRRSGYVWPEKLKRLSLLSGCEISGCKMLAHGIPDMKCRRTEFRMWNVGGRNSGYEISGEGGKSAG